MIDHIFFLPLELCALTLLVGIGIWRALHPGVRTEIDALAPVEHDMRRDGQLLALQAG